MLLSTHRDKRNSVVRVPPFQLRADNSQVKEAKTIYSLWANPISNMGFLDMLSSDLASILD